LGKRFTRLWAVEFEGERMDGDGSSSDLRGGRAGVSARHGETRDGQRGGMQAPGEGPGDAWRGRAGGRGRHSARRRPGEGTTAVAETEQGNRRAQRKKMRGENV
jgi:hypothetical protein